MFEYIRELKVINETPLSKWYIIKKKDNEKQKLQSSYGRETENHNSRL